VADPTCQALFDDGERTPPASAHTSLAAAPGLETIPSSADTMTPRGLDNRNGGPSTGVLFDFRNFRPAVEDVYNRLDKFFPDHDLDKPVVDSVGTSGGNSPTITEQLPPWVVHRAVAQRREATGSGVH
jgi:hypothetical protein